MKSRHSAPSKCRSRPLAWLRNAGLGLALATIYVSLSAGAGLPCFAKLLCLALLGCIGWSLSRGAPAASLAFTALIWAWALPGLRASTSSTTPLSYLFLTAFSGAAILLETLTAVISLCERGRAQH